jgi:hypothetical protein
MLSKGPPLETTLDEDPLQILLVPTHNTVGTTAADHHDGVLSDGTHSNTKQHTWTCRHSNTCTSNTYHAHAEGSILKHTAASAFDLAPFKMACETTGGHCSSLPVSNPNNNGNSSSNAHQACRRSNRTQHCLTSSCNADQTQQPGACVGPRGMVGGNVQRGTQSCACCADPACTLHAATSNSEVAHVAADQPPIAGGGQAAITANSTCHWRTCPFSAVAMPNSASCP